MPCMTDILILIVLAVVAVVLLVGIVMLGRLLHRQGAAPSADAMQLMQQELHQSGRQLSQSLQDLTTNLNERLSQSQLLAQQSQKLITERLTVADKTLGDLKGQLGQLGQATQNILQVGGDIRKLQDILQAPKLRGGLGEWTLENLLADVLPAQHFRLQHTFKTGAKVDALVILANGSVSIDAKFPLTNFQALLSAEDDSARGRARRAFLRDVRGHVDAIAGKYILPAEGTLDFALMFVPAENVYAELLRPEGDLDLPAYARQKKVIPVSPNTLYAHLMAVATGLRGLQIEQNARRIVGQLGQLSGELGLFATDYLTLGKHLANAHAKFDEASGKLDRFRLKIEQIHDAGPEAPGPADGPVSEPLSPEGPADPL
ncbi:MAG: DNA recombination protein RmuC [Sedimentisphaerales bacterium]|nr:DNA recombination protein RmuC [Sedimentisphaerales bacterium]